ncbi:MAG: AAA family ATPase [Kiritimatiellae bacterium]|nr:AAA family ATPase [Kiritimatiellia bacterium]
MSRFTKIEDMAEYCEYREERGEAIRYIGEVCWADALALGTVLVSEGDGNQAFKNLAALGYRVLVPECVARVWDVMVSADEKGETISLRGSTFAGDLYHRDDGAVAAELRRVAKDLAGEVEAVVSEGLAALKGGADPRDAREAVLYAIGRIEPHYNEPGIETAADFCDGEDAPPDYIVEDCFTRGDKVDLVGPSKFGKSFWALSLALHVAAGRTPYCGLDIPRRRSVLYVNLEIKAEWLRRRMSGLLAAYGFDKPPSSLKVWNARGDGEDVRSRLAAVVRRQRPALVILDPVYRLLEPGESESSDEGLRGIIALREEICNAGAATLSIWHDAKGVAGARDIRDRGAGSGWAGRDYDFRFTLTPHRAGDGYAVLETSNRNDKKAPSVTLRIGEAHAYSADPATPPDPVTTAKDAKPRPAADAAKALKWFEGKGRSLAKSTAAKDFGKDAGIGREAARKIIEGLIANGGLVERCGRGRGGGQLIGLPSMFLADGDAELSREPAKKPGV